MACLPTALQGVCICVSVHDAQLTPPGCTDTPRPALWISSPADERLGCPLDTKGPRMPSACEKAHSCCRGQAGWGPHQAHRGRSSGQSRGGCGGALPCSPAGKAPGSKSRETGQGQWSMGWGESVNNRMEKVRFHAGRSPSCFSGRHKASLQAHERRVGFARGRPPPACPNRQGSNMWGWVWMERF